MGLHTGVCEERDSDYFGPVVNRVARLEAVAHGGQVLLSGATAELLSESLPDGVPLRDLGLHRLKDLGRPEHVFQLEAASCSRASRRWRRWTTRSCRTTCPACSARSSAGSRELSRRAVARGSSRLVTLTGAGGSGKTRLALQAAAELLDTASRTASGSSGSPA